MKKVQIQPGICKFPATVTAVSEDGVEVDITVSSGCKAVMEMIKATGTHFDPIELCLTTPGTGAFYEYAKEHFPAHGSCPVIAGIIKCVEAECSLALPCDASIHFVEE